MLSQLKQEIPKYKTHDNERERREKEADGEEGKEKRKKPTKKRRKKKKKPHKLCLLNNKTWRRKTEKRLFWLTIELYTESPSADCMHD